MNNKNPTFRSEKVVDGRELFSENGRKSSLRPLFMTVNRWRQSPAAAGVGAEQMTMAGLQTTERGEGVQGAWGWSQPTVAFLSIRLLLQFPKTLKEGGTTIEYYLEMNHRIK